MGNHLDAATCDRRQLLKSLALGAAAAGWPTVLAGKGLKGIAINHVSYESTDYKRTRDFYVSLLGFQVSDEDARQLYLWAGDTLISAKNTPTARVPRIDHLGFTIADWDLDTVEAELKQRALAAIVSRNDPHDPSSKSAFTRDPNGYSVQLCAKDLETKPAPIVSSPPLKAIGIHHISYVCRDYKKTRDFYAELLGAAVSQDDGSQAYLWLGNAFLVIRNRADGTLAPPIDSVAWTLADWDQERVAAELRRHGLEARLDPAGHSILTRDINGYPLELCSKDLEKKP